MSNLFYLIILSSIWVLGLKIATYEGMLLEKLGEWGKEKVEDGHKIFEAIIVCEFCMPSFHSIVGYLFGLFVFDIPVKFLLAYPLVVMGTSFIAGILWNGLMVLLRYYKHIQNTEKLSYFDVIDRKDAHHKKRHFNSSGYQNKNEKSSGVKK